MRTKAARGRGGVHPPSMADAAPSARHPRWLLLKFSAFADATAAAHGLASIVQNGTGVVCEREMHRQAARTRLLAAAAAAPSWRGFCSAHTQVERVAMPTEKQLKKLVRLSSCALFSIEIRDSFVRHTKTFTRFSTG
jgi:hypothetical protein